MIFHMPTPHTLGVSQNRRCSGLEHDEPRGGGIGGSPVLFSHDPYVRVPHDSSSAWYSSLMARLKMKGGGVFSHENIW